MVSEVAVSRARLPWVQFLTLSLQLCELEQLTCLFFSLLILKMGTIIVFNLWALIKLVPASLAPATSFTVCQETEAHSREDTPPRSHNEFQAEFDQNPGLLGSLPKAPHYSLFL